MKALSMAKKGLLILGRLQFLEGKGRYENIFSVNPPTDIYVYVDRISCAKNGDESYKTSAIQAYAWYYYDFQNIPEYPRLHWIRRRRAH